MPPAERPSDHHDPATPAGATELVRQFTHDVVSPLMSVVALSEVLLLEGREDPRLNDDLRRIHDAAEEAIALVRSLHARLSPPPDPPADA